MRLNLYLFFVLILMAFSFINYSPLQGLNLEIEGGEVSSMNGIIIITSQIWTINSAKTMKDTIWMDIRK